MLEFIAYSKNQAGVVKDEIIKKVESDGVWGIYADAITSDAFDSEEAVCVKFDFDEEFDGIISGVINSGFFVELSNTVEGKVDAASLPMGDYETRNNIALFETLSHTAYTIGDRVRVKCVNVNVNLGQIDFELIKVYNNEN